MAFCSFLFENEGNAELASVVASCAPAELFAHDFTRRFVEAWRKRVETGADSIIALREELSPDDAARLDEILMGTDRGALSELGPARILQDFLRRFLADAIRRKLAQLPVADQELDRERLSLSLLARQFLKSPWQKIVPLMTPTTLENGLMV